MFSHSEHPATEYVQFVTRNATGFVKQLKQETGKTIWLIRGGQLNTLLLNAGLMDEIILTYLPVVFGKGMPLFAPAASESMVRVTETKNDKNGFVQLNLLLRCELQRPIKAKTTRLTYRVVFGWQRTRCYRRKLTYR